MRLMFFKNIWRTRDKLYILLDCNWKKGINPTWGLTIALLVISVFASVTYAKYLYLEEFPEDSSTNHRRQVIAFLIGCCLAVLILFLIVIFAGHSSSEKEMAVDEVLKTTSLCFITAFITWVTWKKYDSADASQNTSDQGVTNAGQQSQNSLSVPGPSFSSGGMRQQRPEEINLVDQDRH